jgi:hypothetical protein
MTNVKKALPEMKASAKLESRTKRLLPMRRRNLAALAGMGSTVTRPAYLVTRILTEQQQPVIRCLEQAIPLDLSH